MNKPASYFTAGLLVGVLIATGGFSVLQRYKPAASDHRGRAQVVLKLGHALDVNHPVHHAIDSMRQRLEELSGGEVTIDIYPGAVLGSETQCIEQLQNGALSMAKTSAAVIENFVPEMAVFGLPYVFRDDQHFWDVLDGEIGSRLLLEGESKFIRGLCYYDAGSRNFYGKSPIRSPDDLAGRKIRVMNSATAVAMVEAFGAAATPIAWGELYSALSQGIVDGAENNLPTFAATKHYEICKHYALDGHTRIPDVLLVGTKAWDRLTAQQQQWLQTAAKESAELQRQLWATATERAKEEAEEQGVTFYEVDVQVFADKVEPMHDGVGQARTAETLAAIRELAADE